MINLQKAQNLLKLLGDELLHYYLYEVFPNTNAIKLVIDEKSFYRLCQKAAEEYAKKYTPSYLDYSFEYDDFSTAFDLVKTNFDKYDDSTLNELNNQPRALAIAVYQVLIAYKTIDDISDLEREKGYYAQLRKVYSSFDSSYFEKQDKLWAEVKKLFERNGKNILDFPQEKKVSYRYVQYPLNQKIIKIQDINAAYNYFEKKLDKNKELSFIDFQKLPFNTYQNEYAVPLC